MQKHNDPSTSEMNSNLRKNLFLMWGTVILVYIVLFEFVLPINNILPKPSLLYDSLISLQKDYSLFLNFTYSVSGVYISIIAAFFILKVMNGKFRKLFVNLPGLPGIFRVFRFFPVLGILILFIFWFPYSSVSEYLIAFIISFLYLLDHFNKGIRYARDEYIEPLLVSAINKKEVNNEIMWKSMEPVLFNSIKKLQIFLWSVILILEYIKGIYGIGNIYRHTLMYRDLAGIFLLSVLLMLIIWLGDLIINFISAKFFDWES